MSHSLCRFVAPGETREHHPSDIPSSAQGRINPGGFTSCNIRKTSRNGERSWVWGAELCQSNCPSGCHQRGAEPAGKQHHPKTALTSHHPLLRRGNPSAPGKRCWREEASRGSPWGWQVVRSGRLGVTLCHRGTKHARSGSCRQLMNGPKNRFPVY